MIARVPSSLASRLILPRALLPASAFLGSLKTVVHGVAQDVINRVGDAIDDHFIELCFARSPRPTLICRVRERSCPAGQAARVNV
jgi:hypothetical protein